jgi:hypothetical protein
MLKTGREGSNSGGCRMDMIRINNMEFCYFFLSVWRNHFEMQEKKTCIEKYAI